MEDVCLKKMRVAAWKSKDGIVSENKKDDKNILMVKDIESLVKKYIYIYFQKYQTGNYLSLFYCKIVVLYTLVTLDSHIKVIYQSNY